MATSCPTYPGLASAFAATRRALVTVAADGAGIDPASVERSGRSPGTIAYLMPTGHNPAGTVMTTLRRQSLAAIADARKVTMFEDLTLADLTLGSDRPPPPVAAFSTHVVAIGSVSKLLWGGLRVGWIRASEPLRTAILAHKAALNLAASAVSQSLTAQLLAAITPGGWKHTAVPLRCGATISPHCWPTVFRLGGRIHPLPGCQCGQSCHSAAPTPSRTPPPATA